MDVKKATTLNVNPSMRKDSICNIIVSFPKVVTWMEHKIYIITGSYEQPEGRNKSLFFFDEYSTCKHVQSTYGRYIKMVVFDFLLGQSCDGNP